MILEFDPSSMTFNTSMHVHSTRLYKSSTEAMLSVQPYTQKPTREQQSWVCPHSVILIAVFASRLSYEYENTGQDMHTDIPQVA